MSTVNTRLTRSPILPAAPKGADMDNKEKMHIFFKNFLQVVRETREWTYDDIKAINLLTEVPASAAATGKPGQWSYDSSWLYICVATDTWKRVAISTW